MENSAHSQHYSFEHCHKVGQSSVLDGGTRGEFEGLFRNGEEVPLAYSTLIEHAEGMHQGFQVARCHIPREQGKECLGGHGGGG